MYCFNTDSYSLDSRQKTKTTTVVATIREDNASEDREEHDTDSEYSTNEDEEKIEED